MLTLDFGMGTTNKIANTHKSTEEECCCEIRSMRVLLAEIELTRPNPIRVVVGTPYLQKEGTAVASSAGKCDPKCDYCVRLLQKHQQQPRW